MTATLDRPPTRSAAAPPPVKPPRPYSLKLTTVLAVLSLIVLVPLYYTLSQSLKSVADATAGAGFAFPTSPVWSNFSAAWQQINAPVAFMWSVILSAIAVAGNIVLPAMVAWAVVRNWQSRFFKISYIYLLAAMFIPFAVVALPQVKLMSVLGLSNPFGVAILNLMFGLSFNTLIYSAYIRGLPEELEESAAIDGATTFQIFRKVVFPLLRPMSATIAIFAFIGSWNDYMMPSLIIANANQQTLPVVEASHSSQLSQIQGVAFASYVLAMIPAIVGYLIGQRWIVAGVMRGAIK